MKIQTFKQTLEYLYKQIPISIQSKFPGSIGLERTKYLLHILGDPQDKIKIIHIAGTSGKGSTAYLTSILLKNHNLKVGLSISPHLLDIRERFQINNQLVNIKLFCQRLSEIIHYIDQVAKTKYGKPTYFEILVALAFYIFHKEKVDYAVMETGMGGLYDATNTVNRKDKLAVITRIGLDHTSVLGKTINKIAYQKAMIFQKGNITLSIDQRPQARKVIDIVARNQQVTSLKYVEKEINYKNIKTSIDKTTFDWQFKNLKLNDLELGLSGKYQVENCSLALAVAYILSQRDKFILDKKVVRTTLRSAQYHGRFETILLKNKKIIMDGAHNPQKMSAFINSLISLYPNQKFSFLIAFKKGKDYHNMLKYIIPVASKIIVTKFYVDTQDVINLSESPETIANILKKQDFKNDVVIKDLFQALKILLNQDNVLVITGSLYLLAEVYKKLKCRNCIKFI